jgi:uncharacterized membrane protein
VTDQVTAGNATTRSTASPATDDEPRPVDGAVSDAHATAVAGTVDETGGADGPATGCSDSFTRSQWFVLAGSAFVVFAAYTTYAFARHAKYETTGFDLGIFDQVIRAYAHFHAPTSPLKGVDYNILGDHFHPILVLLVPLYWIWADPRMLLAAQAALFAVSMVPVARFARRRLGPRPALWTAAVYGLSWPLQRAVHFDFHEIAFAVPLIALMIDALDRRRDRTVIVCCLTLLFVREDMGALVLLVGVLVALRRGPGRRRSLALGGSLATVGVLGYWLATDVVIPAMGPQGFTYWTFNALGPDPVSALTFSITRPWRVAWLMVSPAVKARTLVAIFLPTAFFSLASPYLLLTVPFLAERMLNDRDLLWQTNFHYTSVIAPILVMGGVDAVTRLGRRFPGALRPRRIPLRAFGRPRGGVPLSLTSAWLTWCVVAIAIGMVSLSPNYPVSGLYSGRVWTRNERWHAVHDTLPMIPSGQCVEADNQIAPQLLGRDYVTRVTLSKGLATWVIVDMTMKETGWQTPAPALAVAMELDRGYKIVSWTWPVVLMHKDQPVAPICRGLY